MPCCSSWFFFSAFWEKWDLWKWSRDPYAFEISVIEMWPLFKPHSSKTFTRLHLCVWFRGVDTRLAYVPFVLTSFIWNRAKKKEPFLVWYSDQVLLFALHSYSHSSEEVPWTPVHCSTLYLWEQRECINFSKPFWICCSFLQLYHVHDICDIYTCLHLTDLKDIYLVLNML